LRSTYVTGAGLKELAPLKRLRLLTLGGNQLTSAGLKELRQLNLLHALSLAKGKDDKRPSGPDEVLSLDLSSGVTVAGLKELAPLKRLQSLHLSGAQLTDEGLKGLRELGLLHALSEAKGKDGPATQDDRIVELDLSDFRLSDTGLKELTSLKQ